MRVRRKAVKIGGWVGGELRLYCPHAIDGTAGENLAEEFQLSFLPACHRWNGRRELGREVSTLKKNFPMFSYGKPVQTPATKAAKQ
jgi:hypothetical protein